MQRSAASTENPSAAGSAPATSSAGAGIWSASFLGLLGTQFLGAFNDNFYRWLMIWVAQDLVKPEQHDMIRSVGAIGLMLPFLILAAPAGYLADRFSKRRVMVSVKLAELLIMCAGVAALASGNISLMLGVMFIMGGQSALFGPAKYGSIPELVRTDEVTRANALVGLSTVIAIVGGTVMAGSVYALTSPAASQNLWIVAAGLLGISGLGLASSLMIRRVPAANPKRTMPWNIIQHTIRDLRLITRHRALAGAVTGLAFFWGFAALAQLTVDAYGQNVLDVGDGSQRKQVVSYLLATLAGGVGMGSVLAGLCSRRRIELGLVPIAALGIAITSAALYFSTGSPLATGVLLFLLGVCAGLFDVPLEAFLQHKAPPEARGSVLAAYNFMAFAAMMLAAGFVYPLLGDGVALPGVGQVGLELGADGIFLLAGGVTLVVAGITAYVLAVPLIEFTLRTLVKLLYRVRVEGVDNLPREGGALLVANHVSWIDAILLHLISPRHVRMIGYAPYMQIGILKRMARHYRAIPIEPGADRRSLVKTLTTAREGLNEGDVVCIFPEGSLTRSGEMQPFQPGALSIVRNTNAPIVPVHLDGLWGSIFSFKGGRFFWKLPRRWPYPVTIRFGSPLWNPDSVEDVQCAVSDLESMNHEHRSEPEMDPAASLSA